MTMIAIVFEDNIAVKKKKSCEDKIKTLHGNSTFVWFYPKSEAEERLRRFGESEKTLKGYFNLYHREEKIIEVGKHSVGYLLVKTS